MRNIECIQTEQALAEFLKTESKNEKKENSEIVVLSSLLNEMTLALSHRGESEDIKATASSSANQNSSSHGDSPTSEQIAAELAQLASILSNLQQQIASCKDEQGKYLLETEAAQLKQNMASLQKAEDLISEIQAYERQIADIKDDIQKYLGLEEEYEKHVWLRPLIKGIAKLVNALFPKYNELCSKLEGVVQSLQKFMNFCNTNLLRESNQFSPQQQESSYGLVLVLAKLCSALSQFLGNIPSPGSVTNLIIEAYLNHICRIKIDAPLDTEKYASFQDYVNALVNSEETTSSTNMSLGVLIASNQQSASLSPIGKIIELLLRGDISSAQAQKMIAAIIEQLEHVLALLATAQSSHNMDGPSNSMLSAILSQMNSLISQLKGQIAEFNSNQSQNDANINTLFTQFAQKFLNASKEQYERIQLDDKIGSTLNTLIKVATVCITLGAIVIACAAQQYEVAIILAAFLVLETSGAINFVTDEVAKGLEFLGVPPEEAKVLADVIVILAMIVLTMGVASGASLLAGGEAAGEVAAEESASVIVEETAEESTEEIAANEIEMEEINVSEEETEESIEPTKASSKDPETVQTQEDSQEKTSSSRDRSELLKKIKKPISATLLGSSQSLQSVNLSQDLSTMIASDTHMDEKEKMRLELLLEGLTTLISIVLGLAAGKLSVSDAAEGSLLVKILGPNALKTLSLGATLGGGSMQTGALLGLAATQYDQSFRERAIGKDQASANLLLNYCKFFNENMKAKSKFYTDCLKEEGTLQSEILEKEYAGQEEIAKLLAQSV